MVTLDDGAHFVHHVRLFPPPSALADVAELSWIELGHDTSRRRFSRIVPDHAPHVLWHCLDGGGHRTNLVGARTCHVDVDRSRRRWTVGVRLRPGAVPALFRLPAAGLTDRSAALDDVLDQRVRQAWRAGDTGDDPQTAHRALIDLLVALRVRQPEGISRRARRLVACLVPGPARVDRSTADLGVSDRTVRALSTMHLGMGAKRVLRIRRLHAALTLRMHGGVTTWSRVAARAGYADQAHLVREFRALLGETPGAFLRRGA